MSKEREYGGFTTDEILRRLIFCCSLVVLGLAFILSAVVAALRADGALPNQARIVAEGADFSGGFPIDGDWDWKIAHCDPAVLSQWMGRKPWLVGRSWHRGAVPKTIFPRAQKAWFGREHGYTNAEVEALLSSERIWYSGSFRDTREYPDHGHLTVVDLDQGTIWHTSWNW